MKSLNKQTKRVTGDLVKKLIVSMGVFLIMLSCGCEVDPIEPEVVVYADTMYVYIEGECEGNHNKITGNMMISLAEGLQTGEYCDENTTAIFGRWKAVIGGRTYDKLWIDAEITEQGGTGAEDTVVFVTSFKQMITPLEEGDLYLDTAILYKDARSATIAFARSPGPDEITTCENGDYVNIKWKFTASHVPESENCESTDTLGYTLIAGLAQGTYYPINHIYICYNNADTNDLTPSVRVTSSTDTNNVYVTFTALDTIRNTADDSVKQINLLNQGLEICAWDTLDRAVTQMSAVKYVFTVILVRL